MESSETLPPIIRHIALLHVDEVIETMNRISPPKAPHCIFGILNLYFFAYADHVLLSSYGDCEDSRSIIDGCRQKCKCILDFFESSYPIPEDKDLAFLTWMADISPCGKYNDIEDCVFTNRDTLRKAGFRDLDIDLYVACENFDLSLVRSLIRQGADPNVLFPCGISENDLPLREDFADEIEVGCVKWNVGQLACDFIDCYNGMSYWKAAVEGDDIDITTSYISSILEPAANQVLFNAISPNIRN